MSRLRTLWPYAVALGVAYLAVPLIGGAVLDARDVISIGTGTGSASDLSPWPWSAPGRAG